MPTARVTIPDTRHAPTAAELILTARELAALDTLTEMADAVLNLTYAAEDWRGSPEGREALAVVEALVSRARRAGK